MTDNIEAVDQSRWTNKQETSEVCSIFKGKFEWKKYLVEECHSMLVAQKQQLYELRHRGKLIKGKKTQDSA